MIIENSEYFPIKKCPHFMFYSALQLSQQCGMHCQIGIILNLILFAQKNNFYKPIRSKINLGPGVPEVNGPTRKPRRCRGLALGPGRRGPTCWYLRQARCTHVPLCFSGLGLRSDLQSSDQGSRLAPGREHKECGPAPGAVQLELRV
jgi:hypothetical protein